MEYVEGMKPRVALFYFYSFHPYDPIRNVCTSIVKAILGRRSDLVSITNSLSIIIINIIYSKSFWTMQKH